MDIQKPTFAAYGDSIVSGYLRGGAPDTRFSSILANRLKLNEVNFGHDGLGYLALRDEQGYAPEGLDYPAEIMKVEPDFLLVCLGVNDVPLMKTHSAEVADRVSAELGRIGELFASIPVLVTMYYPGNTLGERSRQLVNWIASDCQRNGLNFSDSFVGPFKQQPAYYSNDGIHPSVKGHLELARLIEDEVSNLLQK
ncbi:hypothetical protein BK816_04850 [Boudabousia tangfeifanii]|uniref:SGNH hydrolase-type esterase domain-containing protein n=1 Tax=Boudabousia tangfeifanii TaxID=1912795 RepID=A0A1D9MK93_9ACTO|nr:SGNH/GDSL hydrolase family protein [Boudabousia tangfeifanii]AOZ72702.1 hypothetical protein BK816_04850 [Boudabousia tangfeifanii]